MARKVNSELREAWRQRIERHQQSGLTVAAFCVREGVTQGTFFTWKRKLRGKHHSKANRPARRQPAPAVRPVAPDSSKATFVQLPISSTQASPWIELVLAEGTIIRVPQQNLAALQVVLRAIGGSSRWPAIEEARDA